LIGPQAPHATPDRSSSTPIFLGCGDVDFHVPLERVRETTQVLRQLGGAVTERIYPNLDHTIHQDEIDFVNKLMHEVSRAK
jgi:predicted esterase